MRIKFSSIRDERSATRCILWPGCDCGATLANIQENESVQTKFYFKSNFISSQAITDGESLGTQLIGSCKTTTHHAIDTNNPFGSFQT